ncbi:MAG: hypothetical protein ABIP78_12780 [Pyrinomonadaceae bacterium]
MKKQILAVLSMIITVLSVNFAAQGKKPITITNPGAIVTFAYCFTAPDPAACETANRVRNDYAYPYTNGSDGVSAVFNLVSGSKDLTIGLTTSQRSVWFDFTDRVAASTGTPAWWSTTKVQNVKPYLNVLKAYTAKELCTTDPCEVDFVTAMNAGQWSISGYTTSYALLWNPGAVSRPVNSPETTSRVNVHYHRNGPEHVFTITPLVNNHGLIVAGLEATERKSVTSAGQYIMPFTMTVTLQ